MSRFLYITLMPLLAAFVSCGSGGDGVLQDDGSTVARVGSQVLTRPDLISNVPYGLSPEDSVKFIRAYVRQWIDARLVGEIAARNINDMSRIDKMVDEYRNELIMWEYTRLMYAQHSGDDINRDSLMAYYERHKNSYLAASPLVKGIFIKIPKDDKRLAGIRKWVMSKNSEDLDKLEQTSMDNGVEYEYFRDGWTKWSVAARKFPTDISGKVSTIPQSGERRFETTSDGYTYILAVNEYIPSGSVMPYDMVEETLIEQFRSANRPEYERILRQQLYENGVKEGIVAVNIDLGIPDVIQQDKNNK